MRDRGIDVESAKDPGQGTISVIDARLVALCRRVWVLSCALAGAWADQRIVVFEDKAYETAEPARESDVRLDLRALDDAGSADNQPPEEVHTNRLVRRAIDYRGEILKIRGERHDHPVDDVARRC